MAGVYIAQAVFPNLVRVGGIADAVIFGLVLGVCNALVRPFLAFVTCPLTLLTLGLFSFVVNAWVFWLATWAPGSVEVSGFWGALVGSLCVTIVTALANRWLK